MFKFLFLFFVTYSLGGFYADASTSHGESSSGDVLKTYKLNKESSKKEILDLIDDLEKEYQIITQLTAYNKNVGKVNVLGMKFDNLKGKDVDMQIENPNAIPEICIVVDLELKIVAYAGICEKQEKKNPELGKNSSVSQTDIDEQNTASMIKMIEKAQTSGSQVQNEVDGEVVFFSGEQCYYKIYGERTFVYDKNEKTLLVLNKPINEESVTGKVELKGISYDFEFDGLALTVKNKDGYLIDKEGDLLNPSESFKRGTSGIEFKLSHEFVIMSTSTPSQIREVEQKIKTKGFNFSIQDNLKSPEGVINHFSFKIEDESYDFKEYEGIPVILIQLDLLHKKARVQTAQ